MITLKSELARHLVTEEPDRCTRELSEIERVARQTLREVREATVPGNSSDHRREDVTRRWHRQLRLAAMIAGR